MQATFKINVKIHWNKSGDYEIIDSSLEESIEDENENGDSQGQESSEEEGLFFVYEILDFFKSIFFSFLEMAQSEDEEDQPSKKKLKNKKK